MAEIWDLSKSYDCIMGAPSISKVSLDIFDYRLSYNDCMDCACGDCCCIYGVDIYFDVIDKLSNHKDEIEKMVKVPFKDWFTGEIYHDEEVPGKKHTRTAKNENGCVLKRLDGRGCAIHYYALKNNLDFREIKPFMCQFFPLYFSNQTIVPAAEVLDGELFCLTKDKSKMSLYDIQKNTILYFFGNEFVKELDEIKTRYEK